MLAVILIAGHTQAFTGDETSYLMYSRSLLQSGRYAMTLPQWQQIYFDITHTTINAAPPEVDDGAVLAHGIYLPTLLAPIGYLFSLDGLRTATLAAGLTGLFCLYRLCRSFSRTSAPVVATALTAFSIPLLPYLHLYYMETFLFLVVGLTWLRLQNAGRTPAADAVTAILILSIPFIQLRGSVVSVALYLQFLWLLRAAGHAGRVRLFAGLAILMAAALVVLNLAIYGSVIGSVNAARPPAPSQWFAVISMQLFNIRHGLIAYAPVWLLGYAGLCIGAIRGEAMARQGLLLAAAAMLFGVGYNAGECWPARFWVLSMPMLGVGVCYWWEAARAPLAKSVGVILIGLTLVNSTIFFLQPNDFLENRQSTKTYQSLYDRYGFADFGLVLPVETEDALDRNAAQNLAIAAAFFVAFAAAAAADRTRVRRSLWAVGALTLTVAAVDLARVHRLAPETYKADIEKGRISITLDKPIGAGYIQFGHEWQEWSPTPNSPRFGITMLGSNGDQFRTTTAADQVVPMSCRKAVKSVTIEDSIGALDIAAEANYRLAVYRSNSWLRRVLSSLRERC